MAELSGDSVSPGLVILAQAGRILASPTSLADSLAQIAKLCVASFAEYASIEVSIEAVEPRRFFVEAGTPAGRSGPSHVVEPLAAGRVVFGSISCVIEERRAAPELRETIAILALQLSVAIASHAAVMREHRIADRFQRALLPDRLPSAEGILFSAAYRPASSEAEVGGDWYDAFEVSEGRFAISIGDVAGHGLDAAVIMGEVRQAMRTAAVASHSPSEVLEYVNGAVRLRESIGMVTAIFALYETATNVVSYAVAGHPPPILVLPGGFARFLPMGGVPLGCADALYATDWTFTVPTGGFLVFYTDGLIENDRDLDLGEKMLLSAATSLADVAPDVRADDLQEKIFYGTSNRDDAAVLTLSVAHPIASYSFSALPIAVPMTRAIVKSHLAAGGIPEEKHFGAILATSEAVTNAVEHAYRGEAPGLLHLTIGGDRSGTTITVEDHGRWRPFSPHDEGGRGIELMHAFTDGVQIQSSRNSTILTLRIGTERDRG